MSVPERYKPIPPHAKKVFEGIIFTVWQWEQKLYDGSTAIFEGLSRLDAVHTVGVLPDGRLLLNEDVQPHRKPVITPPGGIMEPGETPEDAAKREFLEETGYVIGTLLPWHSYRPSPKADWTIYAFVGRDLEKIREPNPGAGEKVRPLPFTFDEFLALGHNPKVRDLFIRIILLEAQMNEQKKQELRQLLYG